MKTAIVFLSRSARYESLTTDLQDEYIKNYLIHESKNEIDFFTVSDCEITDNYISMICVSENSYSEKFENYKNSTLGNSHINKKQTALDKALFLFCEYFTSYDYVWLIEDDVFLPSIESLLMLNKKCGTNDFCVPAHNEKKDEIMDWNWPNIIGKIDRPWFYSMTCAARFSRKMLECIKIYSEKNKSLFFHEVMFNTIAEKNNLSVCCPDELKTICWMADWTFDDFYNLSGFIFHPVKNFEQHPVIRSLLRHAKEIGYVANKPLNHAFFTLMK